MNNTENTLKKKFPRKEVAEILGVSLTRLKHIEKEKALEKRLNVESFRLLEKTKEGRNSYYILELIEDITQMTDVEFCNHKKINKIDKFKIHINNRKLQIEGCLNLITKTSFAYDIGESIYYITKFDKALVEERFMEPDGWIYLAYKDGKCREVEKWEFVEFWKNHAHVKRLLDVLVDSLMKNRINKHEFKLDYNRVIEELGRKGEIYHKIPKYKRDIYFDLIADKMKLD